MLTKLPPWWKPWQRVWRKTPFNPDVFATDLERIRALLRRSGHYTAALEHDLELDGDAVTVHVQVEAGPPITVGEVALVAADVPLPDDERARLRALVPLVAGEVFTEDGYAAGAAAIEADFRQRGYAYAAVERRAVVDTGAEVATATYTITRGIPAVFGATTITGEARVPEDLVRRELQYQAGEAWDPRKLDTTQARVFGLRLFRSVVVKATNLEAGSGVVDVAIEIVEGPTREVQVGVGYGLEDGPRGLLRWQDYDFFGDGRQLGFRLKASQIEQAFESEFRQPFFLSPRQTLIVPLTFAREDEPAFTLQRLRFAPRVERKLGMSISAAVGVNVEYDDLSDVPRATVRRLEEYEARGILASVTGLVERNTTTNLLDPQDGSVLALQAEQAGGDFSFWRLTAEAKRYWPVLGRRVLAARLRVGVADSYGGSGDVPLFRRFYAGGINSTRGYDRWKLGPLSTLDDPVGGRTLLEGSVELRTPIWGKFGGVVFVDVGEVRRQPFTLSASDLQFGAGVGVRYQTLIGPLRLDVGIPFPDAPRGEPSWQIHFSIGQAF
jgi:outer membrane protein insertion porin family